MPVRPTPALKQKCALKNSAYIYVYIHTHKFKHVLLNSLYKFKWYLTKIMLMYIPAVDNQWCISIFGLALTHSLNERDKSCGKLWHAMIWPAGEEEVFNFQGDNGIVLLLV